MFSAPLGLSLQPMARTMDLVSITLTPSSWLIYVTECGETERTVVLRRKGIFSFCTISMYLKAYSGPVSSSLKVWRPKPLCMHWFRMPPSFSDLSIIRMFLLPFFFAPRAAESPAGPPPMITVSYILSFLHCYVGTFGVLGYFIKWNGCIFLQ